MLHSQNIWITDFSKRTESCADKFNDTETGCIHPQSCSLGKQAQWTRCGRCRCGSECQMRHYSKTECQQTSPDTLPDGRRQKEQVNHVSDYHVLQRDLLLNLGVGSILNTRTVYSLRAWTGHRLLSLASLCSKHLQQHQIQNCSPLHLPVAAPSQLLSAQNLRTKLVELVVTESCMYFYSPLPAVTQNNFMISSSTDL